MPTSNKPSPSDLVHWTGLREAAAPALLIDEQHGLLLDANTAAWALWSGVTEAKAQPLSLDRSMPALRALRETAQVQLAQGRLLFWTPKGCLSLICTWQRLAAAPALFAIVANVQDAGSARGSRSAMPAPARPDLALTSRLAHELRTPLGAVIAYSEILAQELFGPLSNPRYRDYAHHIHDSAQHALGVVDRMLATDVDAAGARSRQLRFRDLDPAAIVESCVTVIRPLAVRAGVSLGVEFPASLPRIVADEVSLRQMLLNLLTNAVKFARRGDRVTLAVTHTEDGSLTFAVEDTGPGMVATQCGNSSASMAAKGLGFGIPLTRELAEVNGAALAIESAPGIGTRALISFGKARVVPV